MWHGCWKSCGHPCTLCIKLERYAFILPIFSHFYAVYTIYTNIDIYLLQEVQDGMEAQEKGTGICIWYIYIWYIYIYIHTYIHRIFLLDASGCGWYRVIFGMTGKGEVPMLTEKDDGWSWVGGADMETLVSFRDHSGKSTQTLLVWIMLQWLTAHSLWNVWGYIYMYICTYVHMYVYVYVIVISYTHGEYFIHVHNI